MEETNNHISKKLDFFISFSRYDEEAAKRLDRVINEHGFTSSYDANLMAGENWAEQIVENIRQAKAVVILLSEHSIKSREVQSEVRFATKLAKDYDKYIIPVFLDKKAHDEPPFGLSYFLSEFQSFYMDGVNQETLFRNVVNFYEKEIAKKELYEKLNEYISLKHFEFVFKTISDICYYLPKVISLTRIYPNYGDYFEYVSLLDILWKYVDIIDERGRVLDRFNTAFKCFYDITGQEKDIRELNENNVAMLNVAIYLYLKIRLLDLSAERVDILSEGYATTFYPKEFREEVRYLGDIFLSKLEKQKAKYQGNESKERYIVFKAEEVLKKALVAFSEQEALERKDKSLATKKYIPVSDLEFDEKKTRFFDEKHVEKEKESTTNELESQLFEVAEHINKSNEIFSKIASHKAVTYEFLVCLKTSYERLKNYSEIAGCKDVAAYCIEKIAGINAELDRATSGDTSELEENCFKALLGFSLPMSGEYDAFISYKHEDDDIASNVYSFLKQNLVNAFYDKVTLPKLGKSEYHDAIMDSLDKSKNFILVISDLSYLESHWVKLEMGVYQKELDEGRKEGGNFVMIVTQAIFDKIKETNKKCLPIQYRGCEIMLTSDYKEKLLSYIKPKE